MDADLILHNGRVWTVNPASPTARAIAVVGNRIVAVGDDAQVLELRGPATRTIDVHGSLVLPGFIDAHTHFENAVEAFYAARVIDIDDPVAVHKRIDAAARWVPEGMWITGWELAGLPASRAGTGYAAPSPSLAELDAAAPRHPVLLRRYDGVCFTNSEGLRLARLNRYSPDPPHGRYGRDAETGELTGALYGSAGERLLKILPPKSRARSLIAARELMRGLNQLGIVGIQDIARIDEVSQLQTYQIDVERSFTDVSIFEDLRAEGSLSVRVYPIITMANWREYENRGPKPGSGDELIRYGAAKTFIDAFMMFEPFHSSGGWCGDFSYRVTDPDTVVEDIVNSDRLGFDPVPHLTGDKAHEFILDAYDEAIRRNGPRDRRPRLLHAWYPRREHLARAAEMSAIADITPYHLIRQLHSIDAALGEERASFAFCWRSMIDAGLRLNIVSDWPGSYDQVSIGPNNPLENMYYAVTRRDMDGAPAGGWHREQAMTIDQAIEAYTINPAYSSREEDIKGSLEVGKLADIVVLSRDIRAIDPRQLLDTRVLCTVFDGKVVHEDWDR